MAWLVQSEGQGAKAGHTGNAFFKNMCSPGQRQHRYDMRAILQGLPEAERLLEAEGDSAAIGIEGEPLQLTIRATG